jgi:hypothetical protein
MPLPAGLPDLPMSGFVQAIVPLAFSAERLRLLADTVPSTAPVSLRISACAVSPPAVPSSVVIDALQVSLVVSQTTPILQLAGPQLEPPPPAYSVFFLGTEPIVLYPGALLSGFGVMEQIGQLEIQLAVDVDLDVGVFAANASWMLDPAAEVLSLQPMSGSNATEAVFYADESRLVVTGNAPTSVYATLIRSLSYFSAGEPASESTRGLVGYRLVTVRALGASGAAHLQEAQSRIFLHAGCDTLEHVELSTLACRPTTKCNETSYESSMPTPTSDRICRACSAGCAAGEYEVSPCTLTADRVCLVDEDCSGNPCGSGGTCVEKLGSGNFSCACAPGFSGPMCTVEETSCTDSPCLNGGVCQITSNSSFVCLCPFGYTGVLCSIPECTASHCNEDGYVCLGRDRVFEEARDGSVQLRTGANTSAVCGPLVECRVSLGARN